MRRCRVGARILTTSFREQHDLPSFGFGQIAESIMPPYICKTATRCQHTYAHQPLAARWRERFAAKAVQWFVGDRDRGAAKRLAWGNLEMKSDGQHDNVQGATRPLTARRR